jgi:hypothetical protein
MRIKISFELDNNAFQSDDETLNYDAVADQLKEIATMVRSERKHGNVIDLNGNRVGEWFITGVSV